MSIYSHSLVAASKGDSLTFVGCSFKTDKTEVHLLDSKAYEHFRKTFDSRSIVLNPINSFEISEKTPSVTIEFPSDGTFALVWNHDEMFDLTPAADNA